MRSFATSTVTALLAVTGMAVSPAAAGGPSPMQSHWVSQSSPTGMTLLDVSCSSVSQCFAVGSGATIIKTVNGGRTWTSATSAYGTSHPTAAFTSIRCPVPGVCSIIAARDVVIRTTNGGRTWQSHTVSVPATLAGLGRLACPTRNVCYATASPSGDPITWFNRSPAIFKTSDGTRTWQRLTIPPSVPCPGDCNQRPVAYPLQWISCQSAKSCRSGGDTFIGSHEGYASAVIRTDNGGTSWMLVHHSFDPNIATCPTASVCTGVFYQPLSPNSGPYLIRSTTGGSSWSGNMLTPFSPVLTSIACSGSIFCQLVGPHGKLATAIRLTLSREASPTTRDLNGVACPRAGLCYAVGAGGTVLRKG